MPDVNDKAEELAVVCLQKKAGFLDWIQKHPVATGSIGGAGLGGVYSFLNNGSNDDEDNEDGSTSGKTSLMRRLRPILLGAVGGGAAGGAYSLGRSLFSKQDGTSAAASPNKAKTTGSNAGTPAVVSPNKGNATGSNAGTPAGNTPPGKGGNATVTPLPGENGNPAKKPVLTNKDREDAATAAVGTLAVATAATPIVGTRAWNAVLRVRRAIASRLGVGVDKIAIKDVNKLIKSLPNSTFRSAHTITAFLNEYTKMIRGSWRTIYRSSGHLPNPFESQRVRAAMEVALRHENAKEMSRLMREALDQYKGSITHSSKPNTGVSLQALDVASGDVERLLQTPDFVDKLGNILIKNRDNAREATSLVSDLLRRSSKHIQDPIVSYHIAEEIVKKLGGESLAIKRLANLISKPVHGVLEEDYGQSLKRKYKPKVPGKLRTRLLKGLGLTTLAYPLLAHLYEAIANAPQHVYTPPQTQNP